MRVAFAGSPPAAIPALEALAGTHEVALVVTQPDRAKGRSKRPIPTPVAECAERLGLPVAKPKSINADEEVARLHDSGAQALCVVAFGQILKPQVLALGPSLNVHFSLLPRHRGAAPVEHSIISGDTETGVTIMLMDEGMDTGPIVSLHPTEIGEQEDTGELTSRLAAIGAPALVAAVDRLEAGRLESTPQPVEGATLASRITSADRPLDPSGTAIDLERRVRALSPHVGATLVIDGHPHSVWEARAVRERPAAPLSRDGERLLLACADGALAIVQIQPPGKGRMATADYLHGCRGELELTPPA
jgi:methionyl-tRNA formyltransferase